MNEQDERLVTEWMEPTSTNKTNKGIITAAKWCESEVKRVPGWHIAKNPITNEIALERKQ